MDEKIDNINHIVMLIGDDTSGSVDNNREVCPHLDIRAAHSDLACLRCGSHFPLGKILPLDLDMLNVICDEFRRKHKDCVAGKKALWVISRETFDETRTL